jgi:hypothetical protein
MGLGGHLIGQKGHVFTKNRLNGPSDISFFLNDANDWAGLTLLDVWSSFSVLCSL